VLKEAQRQILDGAHDYQRIELEAMAELAHNGWRPDYIAVRRRADLRAPLNGDPELVVVAAARLGRTRLIDNVEATRPE
jgi:pantoate--beta-alanine ligase